MNENLEIQTSQIRESSIENQLLSTQIQELNIYNQAYLTLETPMIKTRVLHERTKNEEQVVFPINGDYSGLAIAFLDKFNKDMNNEETSLLKNLFTESMNILLGQYFTTIEKTSNYNIVLGAPSIMSRVNLKSLKQTEKSDTYSVGYNLLFNRKEYNCRIVFLLSKNKIIEV